MYILSNKQIDKSLKGMHPDSRVAKKITDVRSSLEDNPGLVMSLRSGSDPSSSTRQGGTWHWRHEGGRNVWGPWEYQGAGRQVQDDARGPEHEGYGDQVQVQDDALVPDAGGCTDAL